MKYMLIIYHYYKINLFKWQQYEYLHEQQLLTFLNKSMFLPFSVQPQKSERLQFVT